MPVSTAIAVAAALLVVATALGLVLRTRDGRRRAGNGLAVRADDLPAPLAAGATLVQFSTALCARCPQVRRMLTGIADAHPAVTHLDIDLTHRNDLAARYHVLQTPTTFLVDRTGAVVSRWSGVPERTAVVSALRAVTTLQEHP